MKQVLKITGKCTLAALVLIQGAHAKADQLDLLRDAMNSSDPQAFEKFMNRDLPKVASSALSSEGGSSAVKKFKSSDDFVGAKIEERKKRFFPNILAGRAPWEANDRAEDLVGPLKVDSLSEMESQGLTAAELPVSPWSDDYWPTYAGQIAKRFGETGFPNSKDWKINADYVLEKDAPVNKLSPAEKYDLLMGDANKTLTKAVLAEGKGFYDESGKVEDWMGICHGWAPAAFMVKRPTKAVKAKSPDGQMITFYPSDIKALASTLWANVETPTNFVSGRCNDKTPAADRNGRVKDADCFDTNPGTWHLAVVNQIGVAKKSFVIDATYDYEVWNQPVYSYSYTYFNPQTMQPAKDANAAAVKLSGFTKDKFKTYRSKDAASVVGVKMQLTYVSETQPSAKLTDSKRFDNYETVEYIYDLELDSSGKIVGGEWYANKHPDFLWAPSKGAKALSIGDRALKRANAADWDGTGVVPAEWRKVAPKSSAEKQPLAGVIDALISLGNRASPKP